MTDPRLLDTLERVAHALEDQVMLQKRALIRMGWLIDEDGDDA